MFLFDCSFFHLVINFCDEKGRACQVLWRRRQQKKKAAPKAKRRKKRMKAI
jgi:hypothetical protein